MKILKPGKVEQRKFVCPKCGCIFVASTADITWHQTEYNKDGVDCPCGRVVPWDSGEPYEEPTPDVIERLADLIYESCNTDAGTAWEIAKHQLEHGVTFREG